MGGARETALASSTYATFAWKLLAFSWLNWKCHVIIVIKTDLSGFVVPMHSGLCEQYVKSLGLTPSGFDFLLRTHPRAFGQQNPPEPVLIPQLNYDRLDIAQHVYYSMLIIFIARYLSLNQSRTRFNELICLHVCGNEIVSDAVCAQCRPILSETPHTRFEITWKRQLGTSGGGLGRPRAGLTTVNTVRSRYLAIIFLCVTYGRHRIDCLWGQGMGCRSCVQILLMN